MRRLFRLLLWLQFYDLLDDILHEAVALLLFFGGWAWLIISGRLQYDKPPGISSCCVGPEQISPSPALQDAPRLPEGDGNEGEDSLTT